MEDDEFAAWSAQIDLITEEKEVDKLLKLLEAQKPPDQRLLSKLYKKKRGMEAYRMYGVWP